MYFKHRLFGFFFNIFRKFPLKNNRISFVIDSNGSFKGNFDYIHKEFQKRGNFQYNFFLKDKLNINSLYKLATSKYIFLNDNFFPMAFMNFKKETKVIQLWHAPGAFKKFGASLTSNKSEVQMINKINQKVNYLITTSDNIKDFYADAFQIDLDKIKAFGIPRVDYYFENHDINRLRENFNDKYPLAKDKKLILYAPTFRDNTEYNNVFNYLDLKKFNDSLSKEYVLVLRLHPKINNSFSDDSSFINCTDYKNEQELLLLADILITDYSSIMIEYAILDKPIFFFVYDLDSYDRGFYIDFEEFVPGKIVKNTDDLINAIKEDNYNKGKNHSFLKTQFNTLDGKASERIVDFLMNNE